MPSPVKGKPHLRRPAGRMHWEKAMVTNSSWTLGAAGQGALLGASSQCHPMKPAGLEGHAAASLENVEWVQCSSEGTLEKADSMGQGGSTKPRSSQAKSSSPQLCYSSGVASGAWGLTVDFLQSSVLRSSGCWTVSLAHSWLFFLEYDSGKPERTTALERSSV